MVRGVIVVWSLGMLLMGPLFSASLSLRIDVPKPEISQKNGNAVVSIPGYASWGPAGSPARPVKYLHILLPPDADLSSTQLTCRLVGPLLPLGKIHFPLAPRLVAEDRPTLSDEFQNLKNVDELADDARLTPDTAVRIVAHRQMRRFKSVILAVKPVVDDLVDGGVAVVESLDVDIQFQTEPDLTSNLPADPAFDGFAAILFHNWADLREQYASPNKTTTKPGYLIITTRNLLQASRDAVPSPWTATLDEFKAHKELMGYNVFVITEDFWGQGAATCDQAADNLRAYLQTLYSLQDLLNVRYVLLVGNPHPTTFQPSCSVPMKLCWPLRQSECPSAEAECLYTGNPTDYYFAELSGNWNANGNAFCGEQDEIPAMDFSPEYLVGRIPVYSSTPQAAEELNTILQRTIDYETPTGDPLWRKKVMVAAAVMSFPEDDDCDFSTRVGGGTYCADWGECVRRLALGNNFDCLTLYEKRGFDQDAESPISISSIDCDIDLTRPNFSEAWNSFHPGVVTWRAHGFERGASRFIWDHDEYEKFIEENGIAEQMVFPHDRACQYSCCEDGDPNCEAHKEAFINSDDASALQSAEPSMVIQVGCNTSCPEDSSNLATRLLQKAAVATCGSARASHGLSSGSWEPDEWVYGGSAAYGYDMTLWMMQSNLSFGAANHLCRLIFGPQETGADEVRKLANICNFNVYGDPSLRLNVSTGVPAAPTDLVLTLGLNSVSLRWSAAAVNPTGFRIDRREGDEGVWVRLAEVNGAARTYTDNLTARGCLRYAYRVRAFNATGESGYCPPASCMPTSMQIAAPAGLIARAASEVQVDLTWTYNSPNVDGFIVERLSGAWQEVARTGAAARSVSVSGLLPDRNQTFRVLARYYDCRSLPSSTASARTPVALPPANLTVVAEDSFRFRLQWQDRCSGEGGYAVQRCLNHDGRWADIVKYDPGVLGPNTVTFVDRSAGREPDVYTYRVRAVFGCGAAYSPFSNEATGMLLEPPTQLRATVSNSMISRSIRLTWADISGFEQSYQVQRSAKVRIVGLGGARVVWTEWLTIANLGMDAEQYTDSAPSGSSEGAYKYRVRALAGNDASSFSNEVQAVF